MIRRPPRSTLDRSSAASDVYKRQVVYSRAMKISAQPADERASRILGTVKKRIRMCGLSLIHISEPHETVLDLVCRLLLEKKKPASYHQTYSKHCDSTYNR